MARIPVEMAALASNRIARIADGKIVGCDREKFVTHISSDIATPTQR